MALPKTKRKKPRPHHAYNEEPNLKSRIGKAGKNGPAKQYIDIVGMYTLGTTSISSQ